MISHDEAQELHLLVGGPLEVARQNGAFNPDEVVVKTADLERARELAALIVSDTDPDNAPKDTSIDIYLTGDADGPDLFGVIYDDEDGVMETAREGEEYAWRVPVQPYPERAERIYEPVPEDDDE